jgi:hypothetical protein
MMISEYGTVKIPTSSQRYFEQSMRDDNDNNIVVESGSRCCNQPTLSSSSLRCIAIRCMTTLIIVVAGTCIIILSASYSAVSPRYQHTTIRRPSVEVGSSNDSIDINEYGWQNKPFDRSIINALEVYEVETGSSGQGNNTLNIMNDDVVVRHMESLDKQQESESSLG